MRRISLDDDPGTAPARAFSTGVFHAALACLSLMSAFAMLGLSELADVLHATTHRFRH